MITGSHPEYWSERALDALEGYVGEGGRLMYMGGNGFYWVVSYREERAVADGGPQGRGRHARLAGATRASCTTRRRAERGGLWRLRGRPPQKLTGVGFTTEGFDYCRPYRRMPDSFHKSVAWIMDGIGDEELIGDFGLALGGAGGLETERYDLELGTPPHARLLATADGFSDNYPGVHEDILFNYNGLMGTQNPLVRADMVYFTTRNDGAVFSTGSIAWSSSLPSQRLGQQRRADHAERARRLRPPGVAAGRPVHRGGEGVALVVAARGLRPHRHRGRRPPRRRDVRRARRGCGSRTRA